MDKIILGTAQFGMDYGINNKRGKIPHSEVSEILKLASGSGIDTLDTAGVYGVSERVLGNFIKSQGLELKIISKLSECKPAEINRIFNESLGRLNLPRVYGYLIHNFQDYKLNSGIWQELSKLKIEGKINKIGFSLYYPHELKDIIRDNLVVDIIQVPFSVFDRRFEPYLKELKNRKIEIHARSIFLQGLAFKKPEDLGVNFAKIKERIRRLNALSEKSKIPVFALCLGFVLKNAFIDKAVIGVDGIQNLKDILRIGDYAAELKYEIMQELNELCLDDEENILPFKWSPEKFTCVK